MKKQMLSIQSNKTLKLLNHIAFSIIFTLSIFLLFSPKANAQDARKAEMYLGDYELRANKVGSVYTYEEIKYIETGSAKVIKKRTSTTNTWVSSYYHTNHQGSTSVVTANNGRKDIEYNKGRLRYFPYGEQITSHNINTQVVADTYTGQKRDTESNLMFYNARLYNQKTGLFMQADSVNDGLNRYAYVGGNPLSKVDPSGQFANFIIGAIAGGAIDIISQVGFGMLEGKSFGDSVSDINWVSVGASTVLGAATSGASAVTSVVARTVGRTAATVLVTGALATGEVAGTIAADLYANQGAQPSGEVAKQAAIRGVVNVVGFGVAGHALGKVATMLGRANFNRNINILGRYDSETNRIGRDLLNLAESNGIRVKFVNKIRNHPMDYARGTVTGSVDSSTKVRVVFRGQDSLTDLAHELGHVLVSKQRFGKMSSLNPYGQYEKELRKLGYNSQQRQTLGTAWCEHDACSFALGYLDRAGANYNIVRNAASHVSNWYRYMNQVKQ